MGDCDTTVILNVFTTHIIRCVDETLTGGKYNTTLIDPRNNQFFLVRFRCGYFDCLTYLLIFVLISYTVRVCINFVHCLQKYMSYHII